MTPSLELVQLLPNDKCQLPSATKTRSGVEFDPSQEIWNYRDEVYVVKLHFGAVEAPVEVRESLKRVLVWYAEHHSPKHLTNLFDRFKHFASTIHLSDHEIRSVHLINYRDALDSCTEWYLGTLSGLLLRWSRMCIPGVRPDAVKYLTSIRIKGNPKGVAVRTMDPEQGRFTDIELTGIRTALDDAYATGRIALDKYVLALLFIALGPRPIQYAAMKVCDFAVMTSAAGMATYIVSVPRAKKRKPDARSSFKKRTLIPEIGQLVQDYADKIKRKFIGILDDPAQAPLFPAKGHRAGEPAGFAFHRTSQSLSKWFENTMDGLLIHSVRTGRPMKMHATRFRRTLACRAADEGHGELVIAELLDHNDTQNVGVYVEATPGMMERMDHAVALWLAPMAQAFAGTIIRDESHARRAGDPSSRIRAPQIHNSKPVGNCGQFGFCGLLAPVACYTCRNFEPWLDGPHAKVLDSLITERERLLQQTDKRIASINDRTILAIAEVVRRCSEINAEKKEDRNG